jgi:hypothetical protein
MPDNMSPFVESVHPFSVYGVEDSSAVSGNEFLNPRGISVVMNLW